MAFPTPGEVTATCTGFFTCMAEWANAVTQGFFWTAMLIGFSFVMFMATQRFGSARSFGFASIVGLLGAIWLATLQLMPWEYASIFILTGVVGFVVLILQER